ncbi:MAG: hypothetical protein IKU19_08480, partial [Clostridia bacterium]|nr:hypothetical protein [Clostridia bacterium]
EDGALGDHVYGTEYQTDKDKHWKECTLCQAKNGETAHTPGDEATATAPQTCTICKYIIKAAVTEHTHAWLDTWEKDATNHWHKCTGTDCTEKKDSAAHVFENDCDKTCDTCGYEREVTHKYGEKHSTDAQNHWYECSVCKDKKDSEAHKPGDAATATKDQTCTVCGYIIKKATGTETTAPHTHDVADSDWISNASKHWKLCSCGEKIDQASHKWNAGKVKTEPTVDKEGEKVFTCTVCSATKTERIAKLDPPATSAPVETTEPVVETTEPSVETTDPAETTPSIDGTTEPVGTTGPIGTTGPVSTNPSNPSNGNGGSNVGTIIIVIIGIIVLLAAAAAVVLLMIGDSKSKSRRR